jgi:hypothetical protein
MKDITDQIIQGMLLNIWSSVRVSPLILNVANVRARKINFTVTP